MPSKRFPPSTISWIDQSKILGIRAGKTRHRFTGVWPIVVDGRVFVRSWGVKPDGWYSTFRSDPSGLMQVGERRVRIRAVRTRSERLKAAVDAAYATKFPTPASRKWVKDLCRPQSRETTTELVPA
jgi:hypothetical protein